MEDRVIRVRMAEFAIINSPGILTTIGLGSCIGIALYDKIHKIGGLIHIMLPKNKREKERKKAAKYADTGIPLLVEEMKREGASDYNLIAKIAGGANMFNTAGVDSHMKVGKRNIASVKRILDTMRIKVQGEEVGKNYGRTMKFFTDDGKVLITSYKHDDIIL